MHEAMSWGDGSGRNKVDNGTRHDIIARSIEDLSYSGIDSMHGSMLEQYAHSVLRAWPAPRHVEIQRSCTENRKQHRFAHQHEGSMFKQILLAKPIFFPWRPPVQSSHLHILCLHSILPTPCLLLIL